MKKILLTIILGIFLITLVSASCPDGDDCIGGTEINSAIDIYQTCNNCTYCNFTQIKYPNKTTFLSNIEATQDETYFSYNILGGNNTELGEYTYCYDCGNALEKETGCLYYLVTTTGFSQSTSQGIGSAIFLILMVILMFTFGVLGFRLFTTENLWVLGVFFEFLAVLLLVYNTWLGYEYHRLFTGLPNSSIPEVIFYIFLLILVLGLLVSLALLFLNWKKVFKYIKNEIKRKQGDNKDVEDWDFNEWGGNGPYGK